MKKIINCKFKYKGKKYSKRAILSALSSGSYVVTECNNNECIDIWEDDILDLGYWSIIFEIEPDELWLEVRFKYDAEKYILTFDYIDNDIWMENCLKYERVEDMQIKITNKR